MSKFSNRLISEKSPYLLQHAYNPVDWFPWGKEAFEKAKNENKPILLSIGYSTCHWCHVMEHESFEDENLASYLNKHFISIKVDREERPDIDKVYMDVLHFMGEQGGWPLNMFLTPDKLPITGGTYFPPVPKYGRKSFLEVLEIIQKAWIDTQSEIKTSVQEFMREFTHKINSPERSNFVISDLMEKTVEKYKSYFDEDYAGFKTNRTNKFPPSMALSFLIQYSKNTKNHASLNMVEKTLSAMKKGGIYDQIRGGIFRYSTDHFWLVPHFEKMLYDNALFLKAVSEFYWITKNEYFKKISFEMIQFLEDDFCLKTGGVSSAIDADSEGEEGKVYLWSYDEMNSILGNELILKYWGVTKEGNFEGKNILTESSPIDQPLDLENAKQLLLKARTQRIQPLLDDKIITSWNGLFITSMAISGIIYEEKGFIKKAEQVFEFIQANLELVRKSSVRHTKKN